MKRFLKNMVANWKKAKKVGASAPASRRRSFRPGLEQLEERTVPTILFDPVVSGPEVLQNSGATMSPSQLAYNNPYALKNPTVYFMFVGPAWGTDNNPIAAVGNMTRAAQAILSSNYLSGLKQYGSDGQATYGGQFVDPSLNPDGWRVSQSLGHPYSLYSKGQNPDGTYPTDDSGNTVFYETGRVLLTQKPSWAPSSSDGTRGPIYVVVRYDSSESGGEGTNAFGLQPGEVDYVNPNNDPDYRFLPQGMNFIDLVLAPPSASDPNSDVDSFSWAFSHELVERISTGTGDQINTGIDIVSDAGWHGQIADGEPENSGNGFAWRLNGSNGSTPKVTSYWSVQDQAFIVPEGSRQSVLLEPLWGRSQINVWLHQGNLNVLNLDNGYQLPTDTTGLIDANVQSFVTDRFGHVFYLTGNSQVWEYDAGTGNKFSVVGSNTTARAVVGWLGNAWMLAHNTGQPDQLWAYGGSPNYWAPVSGAPTNMSNLVTDGSYLYVLGNYGGANQVWRYDRSGNWTAITGTNTTISQLTASIGPSPKVYMLAHNSGSDIVYQYTGSGTDWGNGVPGQPSNVTQIVAAYGGVTALAGFVNAGTVWQFHAVDNSWSSLTWGTNVLQIASSGGALYMVGNNGTPNQVWRYTGTPYYWTQLSGSPSTVYQIAVQGSQLYMVADNGPGMQVWQYNGSPFSWTALHDTRWVASQIQIADDGTLSMYAAYNGGTFNWWTYGGSYDQWTLSPSAFNQRIAWGG
jgi:hypothetical protein